MDYVSPHHRGKDVSTIMYSRECSRPRQCPRPRSPLREFPPTQDTPRSATLPIDSDGDSPALCGGAPRRHGPWHHGIAARCGGSGKASPGICSPAIYPRVDHRRSRQLAHPGFRWPPGDCVRCLHCRPGFDATNDLHQLPGTLWQARTHGSQTQRSHRPFLRREAEAGSGKVAAPPSRFLRATGRRSSTAMS